MPLRTINCRGCTQCCRGPNRVLQLTILPEEYHQYYATYKVGDKVFLATQANGDCVYLQDGQCSIYQMRPPECIAFDCRDWRWDIKKHPHMSLAKAIHND